jgi:hypothetical protein
MRLADLGWEYGDEWVCSQQSAHILSDPGHWSVYVVAHDIGDGQTYTGPWPAHDLTPNQLRAVLGMDSEPTGEGSSDA